MGVQSGSKRYVFPDNHPSGLQKIPETALEFQDTVFQFRALPFSISTAPWLFTKVAGVVKELFHREGLSLFQYLDDWLGDTQSTEEACHRLHLLVQLWTHLEFQINHQKSELVPTQVFYFVGMNFSLGLVLVFLTEKNLAKVVATAGVRLIRPCSTVAVSGGNTPGTGHLDSS